MQYHSNRLRINTTMRLAFFLILSFLSAATSLAADHPQCLKQAVAQNPPAYEKDVPAVVLLKEYQVSVASDGALATTANYAVKMLNREGRQFAIARALYLMSSGKIRDLSAWVMRPDGTYKEYDKKS